MIDINSFFNDSTKKSFLKWIKDDYKNIPLCIYGGNGLGKAFSELFSKYIFSNKNRYRIYSIKS